MVGQRLRVRLDKLHVLMLVCYIKMGRLAKRFLLKERRQWEAVISKSTPESIVALPHCLSIPTLIGCYFKLDQEGYWTNERDGSFLSRI